MIGPYKAQWDFQDSGEVLLVDKPLDWTSFDVVKKIRFLFNVRKVGHAGTLDPKATGLLIICTGRQTRSILSYQDAEKEYTGTFELGVRTPSFDSETEVFETRDFANITESVLKKTVQKFVGRTIQTTPMYSAAKYNGMPLYAYARKGQMVKRSAREIEITDLDITRFQPPMVDFRVVCSKGTYIRALVEDLGNELECGCTLRSLRRTRIGKHTVDDALTIEDLKALRENLGLNQRTSYEVGEPA
jgi:tRNA pseudouridine55 synthase